MPAAGRPRRAWRSLRARLIVGFAAGGLLLAGTMGVATYGLSRGYLLRQRESAALRQASLNASFLQDALRGSDVEIIPLLEALETATESDALIHRSNRWFATSVAIGPHVLPIALRDRVLAGEAVRQRIRHAGDVRLVIGLPMPAVAAGGAYFESFLLTDLTTTLGTLRRILVGTSAGGAVAAALLGLWGSRRVLSPLRDVSAAATAIAGGQLETRLADVHDPELSSLAASFNAMVDALEKRIERDARFASDVSHELRSPLTALGAALEVLEARRSELSDRGRDGLDVLSAEVRQFERLVADLLEISRIDAGVADLVLEEVRMAELVRRAVASHSDAPVTVADGAEDVVAEVDKRRVERVLTNLLDNASVHAGGATAVTVGVSDGGVEIGVDDAGPGIDAADQARVFERFARGASARRRGVTSGTGLGLALVAEHVKLHGGSIRVEEAPSGGARFVVWLPSS